MIDFLLITKSVKSKKINLLELVCFRKVAIPTINLIQTWLLITIHWYYRLNLIYNAQADHLIKGRHIKYLKFNWYDVWSRKYKNREKTSGGLK